MDIDSILVFDVEANGLDDATLIHCICIKNIINGQEFELTFPNITKKQIIDIFLYADRIIGHNIFGYDLPIIKRLIGVDLLQLIDNNKFIDTYVWSRVLSPDRELPLGCPTSIKNPVTKENKIIGPHGLESWGYRTGKKKPEIHDWREFSTEIVYRCWEDVSITEMTYYELCKEAGIDPITHEIEIK